MTDLLKRILRMKRNPRTATTGDNSSFFVTIESRKNGKFPLLNACSIDDLIFMRRFSFAFSSFRSCSLLLAGGAMVGVPPAWCRVSGTMVRRAVSPSC